MSFIKEVEYVFEYEGSEYRETYCRDTHEGRRYRLTEYGGEFPTKNYTPIDAKATGEKFSVIKPKLIGANKVDHEETLLSFELPDINKIIILRFSKYSEHSASWSKSGTWIFDKVSE